MSRPKKYPDWKELNKTLANIPKPKPKSREALRILHEMSLDAMEQGESVRIAKILQLPTCYHDCCHVKLTVQRVGDVLTCPECGMRCQVTDHDGEEEDAEKACARLRPLLDAYERTPVLTVEVTKRHKLESEVPLTDTQIAFYTDLLKNAETLTDEKKT